MARPKSTDANPKNSETLNVTVDTTISRSASGITTIPGVKPNVLTTLIIGTAPLIVNKFSEKAMQMILDKHMGEASGGREKKDPVANFNAARHLLSDGSDGFPAGGLKASIVSGFQRGSGIFQTQAKGGIRVHPDCPETNLVRIITPNEPIMREDTVRNASGVVDIRHRPMFYPWAMRLRIEYLDSVASATQILQAIAICGYTQGIGEWRPSSPKSKTGTYGTWRLADSQEIDALEDGTLLDLLASQRMAA